MSEVLLAQETVFETFSQIYGQDIKFRIVRHLCNSTHASMREIARHVGISHKNLSTHLDQLLSKGMIEVVYDRPNMRLYRASEKSSQLVKLFKQN